MASKQSAAKVEIVPAAKFRANCLAFLDRVARTKRGIVVTKRGHAVARVLPVEEPTSGSLEGSIVHEEDIVSPVEADWDADR
jgi:prevent-host-death family protein